MDPEANLTELRKLCRDAEEGISTGHDTAERMAELFLALDQWLSLSGFLPADWER